MGLFTFNMVQHLLKGREENWGTSLKCLIDIPYIIEDVIHSSLVQLYVFTRVILGPTQTIMLSVLFLIPVLDLMTILQPEHQ